MIVTCENRQPCTFADMSDGVPREAHVVTFVVQTDIGQYQHLPLVCYIHPRTVGLEKNNLILYLVKKNEVCEVA